MELQTKAYFKSSLGKDGKLYMGELVFMKNKIMKFIKGDNAKLIEDFSSKLLPIYREDFTIEYTDKHHDDKKIFDAIVNIKGKILFGIDLGFSQKLKLKWITKYFWIQKGNNFMAVITIILSLLTILISYLNYTK